MLISFKKIKKCQWTHLGAKSWLSIYCQIVRMVPGQEQFPQTPGYGSEVNISQELFLIITLDAITVLKAKTV